MGEDGDEGKGCSVLLFLELVAGPATPAQSGKQRRV